MFRRRGCLFGCGSFLFIGLTSILLIWFVVIPRVANVFEESVRDGLATVIADEIDPLYSRAQLQDGEDVRFTFESINRHLRDTSQDDQVNKIELLSNGDQMVMRGELNGREMEIAFVPQVTQDGRLRLVPVDEGGWWQEQLMNVLGGGLEAAINEWMQRNGVVLSGVALEPGGIVLSVVGE